MIITYQGVEFFKVQYGDVVVAFNPISKSSKLKGARFGADIAVVSANLPDFNGVDAVTLGEKKPFVISGPGEYEYKGVLVHGLPAETSYGGEKMINTVYLVSLEGINLCFLGALNKKELSAEISEAIEEIEVEKKSINFLYEHRGEFWFSEKGNPKNRFKLEEAKIGPAAKFLKPNSEVTAAVLDDQILNVKAPIKVDLKITETPPGERGNTAQGGTKMATLETGAEVAVPLFINTGDIIRVNTDTGTYVERMEKSKE